VLHSQKIDCIVLSHSEILLQLVSEEHPPWVWRWPKGLRRLS